MEICSKAAHLGLICNSFTSNHDFFSSPEATLHQKGVQWYHWYNINPLKIFSLYINRVLCFVFLWSFELPFACHMADPVFGPPCTDGWGGFQCPTRAPDPDLQPHCSASECLRCSWESLVCEMRNHAAHVYAASHKQDSKPLACNRAATMNGW